MTKDLPEDLVTGIESIDKQHLTLLQTFDSIIECMESAEPKDEITKLIDFLVSYTNIHLETEEKIMEEQDYKDYELHKREHELFRMKIQTLEKSNFMFRENKKVLNITVRETKKWIMSHVMNTDVKMAAFIKNMPN
ncbi:MAG: hypothetical protein C0602_10125 [Denitrovibrio sp.]|nr:MAG: hypothetical protein C0602_10125 [Denitrovibrio sp.]